MSGQRGVFDIDERYAALSAASDPLQRLASVVDFEVFRPVLNDALRCIPASERSIVEDHPLHRIYSQPVTEPVDCYFETFVGGSEAGAPSGVLLLKQYRHALRRFSWEIPRGFGRRNESAERTLERQLAEEVQAAPQNVRATWAGWNPTADGSATPSNFWLLQ